MTDEQFEEFEKAVSFANSNGEIDDSILENVSGKKGFWRSRRGFYY